MPRGLEVFQGDSGGGRSGNAAEVDRDLAEKFVGAVAVVVPYGDFEDPMEEIRGANCRVYERLAPDGIASVDHSFSAPLRPLTAVPQPQVRSRVKKEWGEGRSRCGRLVTLRTWEDSILSAQMERLERLSRTERPRFLRTSDRVRADMFPRNQMHSIVV